MAETPNIFTLNEKKPVPIDEGNIWNEKGYNNNINKKKEKKKF